MEPRAVSKMKTGDGIRRLPALFHAEQIVRAQGEKLVLQLLWHGPCDRISDSHAPTPVDALRSRADAESHVLNPGIGEIVANRRSQGISARNRSTTPLISALPNENPRSPGWQLLIE